MNFEKTLFWACGFVYGEALNVYVPFEQDTLEAKYWRQGWIQGALKRVGLPYYGSQLEQSINREKPLSLESELWARKFEDHYFSLQ